MGVSQFCVVVGMNDVPGHFGYCFFLNLKVSGTHIITSNLIYFYSIPRDLHPQRDAYKLDAWEQPAKNKPEASLNKGGGLRPPPTQGAGRSAARPLCGRWPKAASFIEAGCRPEFGILLPSL
jgi:hypothetical protein